MNKKKFYSQLFCREIPVTEKDYWPIVQAELLYRITDLKEKKCHCFQCKDDLAKYERTLQLIKEEKQQQPVQKK